MAKYIATFSDLLNDIEITGFIVMTDKEVERFEELASSITWDFTYPMLDEVLKYSCGDDLLTRIDFREITNEEFKILNKVFDEGFGIFIKEDDLLEIIGDDEEDEEEDDTEYERSEDDEEDDDY